MDKKLPILFLLTLLFSVSLYFQVKNTLADDDIVTPPVTSPETPTVTPSETPTMTPTLTPSLTPTMTPSVTPSTTPSATPSLSPAVTVTPSTTPSGTPSVTVTPTMTPTPTPPVENTNISGNVFYQVLGFLHHGNRFDPAANVTVNAQGLFTNKTYSTHTDGNGNYSLTVVPGIYFVMADNGNNNTFFVPTINVANTTHHNENHENFKGLVFDF